MIAKFRILFLLAALTLPLALSAAAHAQAPPRAAAVQAAQRGGGEANLVLPGSEHETSRASTAGRC